MRWDVLGIWLLPAFCEDLTWIAKSGDHLTKAGQDIATAFVWLSVVVLWMLCVSHFTKREKTRTTASVIQSGIFVKLEEQEYLMVPADLEMQAEVRKENRRARHIRRLERAYAE